MAQTTVIKCPIWLQNGYEKSSFCGELEALRDALYKLTTTTTGWFTDKPTCAQSSCELVNSPSGRTAD